MVLGFIPGSGDLLQIGREGLLKNECVGREKLEERPPDGWMGG